jgi:hypothetical protein
MLNQYNIIVANSDNSLELSASGSREPKISSCMLAIHQSLGRRTHAMVDLVASICKCELLSWLVLVIWSGFLCSPFMFSTLA